MAKRTTLSVLSVAELEREIARRKHRLSRYLTRLKTKRASLVRRLSALDAEIARHGGAVRGGRVRPRNEMNLADSLAKVLKNATMSVNKVTQEVQRAGYRTTSPNFRTIVNQTLIKDPRFKRVSRGKYTAR